MIYTIGHEKSYKEAREVQGTVIKVGKIGKRHILLSTGEKYTGGYAFKTITDAQKRIEEEYLGQGYTAFGLKADWNMHTYPAPDGWWRYLLIDAEIIFFDKDKKKWEEKL